MYAEACAAAGGASYKASNCPLNALEAINKIRTRAGVAEVAAQYIDDNHKFMDEVRRERACELAFGGHRFNDLRRWLLLDKAPYNVKTSQEFTRVSPLGQSGDVMAKDEEVSGFKQKQILKRDLSSKHYWLPLKRADSQLYPDFKQNPGWK
jgi:hypothetical protein